MTDIKALSAEQILFISLTDPERLFTGDADTAKAEWRELSKLWHPDRNDDPDANRVLAHINALYDEAIRKLTAGSWQVPGLFTFKTTAGKEFGLRYKKKRTFELGDVYIGEKLLAYVVSKDYEDLYRAAKRQITGFKFANDKMKAEVARYLPKITDEQVTSTHMIMVLEKTPDVFCLADVLQAVGGKLDPKHVAWIVSRLLNIECYLTYAGLTHNDISPETVFISPEHHSALLLGGWWYSVPVKSKFNALPIRTMDMCDADIIKGKVGLHELDSELIKLTGRELLGDPIGSVLLREKAAPPAMLTWLRSAGSAKSFEEYNLWYDKVLKESFGPRKFIPLDITAKEVYTS